MTRLRSVTIEPCLALDRITSFRVPDNPDGILCSLYPRMMAFCGEVAERRKSQICYVRPPRPPIQGTRVPATQPPDNETAKDRPGGAAELDDELEGPLTRHSN